MNSEQHQHPATAPAAGDNSSAPGSPGTAPAPAGPEAEYQGIADSIMQQIAAIEAAIPDFQRPRELTSSFVRTHLHVPTEFLANAIAAAAELPQVAAGNLDPAEGRAALAYEAAFVPVAERFRVLVDGLVFTTRVKRASVVSGAQKIYGITRAIARDPNSTLVAAHARLLKQSRGVVRKKAAGQQPQTPEQSPTPIFQADERKAA